MTMQPPDTIKLQRYTVGDCVMLPANFGRYLIDEDVIAALKWIEDDENPETMLANIREFKEQLS